MKTNTIQRTALAALTTLLCWPAAALAQGECGDTTCEEGFTCETTESPCPLVDCEGEDCVSCEPEEFSYCVNAPCESDDECGDFMVCGTLIVDYDCPVAASCAEGEPCEADAALECTPVEGKQCVAKWSLPCEADADCGEGFTCTPNDCGCAGGSAGSEGMAASGAETDPAVTKGADAETRPGATDPVAPDSGDCSCPEELTSSCQVNEIECESADDCPADWTCDESFRGGGCAATSEGDSICDDEPTSGSLCQPPYDKVYADGGILATTSDLGGGGIAESGVATGGEETPEDTGVTPPRTTAVTPDSNEAEGDATGAGSGDDVTPLPNAPSMNNGGNAMSGKGCAVASSPGGGSGGLLWSALGFGLLLGLRRRR